MNPILPQPDGSPLPYGGPPAAPLRSRWLLRGGLGCFALVVLSFVGISFYLEWAWVGEPATPGHKVPAKVLRKVRGLVPPVLGEEILYLHVSGSISVEAGFSFFTYRRLVLYSEEWEKPTLAVNLCDIASITPTFGDLFIDDTCLAVVCEDGTELVVMLSTMKGGDKRYYEALKKAWEVERRRTGAPPWDGK